MLEYVAEFSLMRSTVRSIHIMFFLFSKEGKYMLNNVENFMLNLNNV